MIGSVDSGRALDWAVTVSQVDMEADAPHDGLGFTCLPSSSYLLRGLPFSTREGGYNFWPQQTYLARSSRNKMSFLIENRIF